MKQESLTQACASLQRALNTVERQYDFFRELTILLEHDMLLINKAFEHLETTSSELGFNLMWGTLQKETGVVLEHQARLQQLLEELAARRQSNRIDGLILYFSRLFAAHQDTAILEELDDSTFATERLVHGMLPSKTIRFLSGEGQLMLGKFASRATNWPSMLNRLDAHLYWMNEVFKTLPYGHCLSQPLLMLMQAIQPSRAAVAHQVEILDAISALNVIATDLGGGGRVFALERLHLEELQRDFPTTVREVEE